MIAPANAGPQDERLSLVVADLQKRRPSKPRKAATLRNTMNSVFQMQLTDSELDSLLSELQSRKIISVQDERVAYALPGVGT